MLITNGNEAARRFSFLQNPIQTDRLAPITLKKSEFLAQGNNPQDKLEYRKFESRNTSKCSIQKPEK